MKNLALKMVKPEQGFMAKMTCYTSLCNFLNLFIANYVLIQYF